MLPTPQIPDVVPTFLVPDKRSVRSTVNSYDGRKFTVSTHDEFEGTRVFDNSGIAVTPQIKAEAQDRQALHCLVCALVLNWDPGRGKILTLQGLREHFYMSDREQQLHDYYIQPVL